MLQIDLSGAFTEDVLTGISATLDAGVERALDQSAAAVLNRLRTSFLAETNPWGSPWIPSAAGIARRAKGGTGTLFDTGTLFRSIQLTKKEPGLRVISTDVPYAVKHQFGLEGMVKREFLTVTEEHETLVKSIFEFMVQRLIST